MRVKVDGNLSCGFSGSLSMGKKEKSREVMNFVRKNVINLYSNRKHVYFVKKKTI